MIPIARTFWGPILAKGEAKYPVQAIYISGDTDAISQLIGGHGGSHEE